MKLYILLILFFLCSSSLGALTANLNQKIKVRSIILEVRYIGRTEKNLDEFGKKTIKQSKDILDIGADAVYILPYYLNDFDWKVRFWIIDILGYLENPDAERPLVKTYQNENEDLRVRNQAMQSLKRLQIKINTD